MVLPFVQVWLSSSSVMRPLAWYSTGGLLTLHHTLPTGSTHSEPSQSQTASTSVTSNMLRCLICPNRRVALPANQSASQPPSPDAPYCPQSGKHYLLSAEMNPLFALQCPTCDHTDNQTQIKWRSLEFSVRPFLVAVCARTNFYTLLLIGREFRCLRVLLRFHSPACCLPLFAIQMSMHKASCEAETAVLSSVSHRRHSFPALASELNHSHWLLCWKKWAFCCSFLWNGTKGD